MKVALVSRSAWPLHEPGGLERAVFQLARHLRAAGADTTLFTRPASQPGAFPGPVVPIRYGRWPLRHGGVLDRSLNYPLFSAELGRALAARVAVGAFDVVCAQGVSGLGYGRLRRGDPALRAPLLVNPQGMEEHKARGVKRLALWRLRALSREAAALADRVIATDESTRGECVELLGVAPSRVAVVPNGIDEEALREATPAAPRRYAESALPVLASADPLLLSVGRLERYKGFDDVLAALELLGGQGRLPERWAWAVVGEGPRRRALAARAQRAGWLAPGALQGHAPAAVTPQGQPRVHMLGRVDERLLHALYERADVFVHAPHYEGSSLVTLEAMAHGLPVVATRAGGIPDKVVPGRTGLLAEPGDPASLAGALAAAFATPDRRATLGAAARELAVSRFGWPALARRTLDLFEEVLRERSR